jgi:ABC-type polysaccharide/polyol phosphate export permease
MNYVRTAIIDILSGLRSYEIWTMLAWMEIKQRYRRSVLGPFWLTLSAAIMIFSMGPLYSTLFGQHLNDYFLYLATSIIAWQLISTMINDSCQAFIGAEGFIKQCSLPLSVYVLRIVWKNLIIFLHNFIVIVLVAIFFPPKIEITIMLFILALIIFAFNAVWVGLLIGLICARFRDVTQIVASIVGLAFFVTPIMWKAEMLGSKSWLINLNPIYHFIQIMRAPIIGDAIDIKNWIASALITIMGYTVTFILFGKFKNRVAYWV